MKLEIKDLCFAYGTHEIVQNVSFEAEEGQILAVLGINGVGKSTMLRCINRINRPRSGKITVGGKDVARMDGATLAKHIGYVSQNCEFSESTVFDAVLLGRKPFIQWDVTGHDLEIVQEVLGLLSLEGYAMRSVNELSGGERQKVAIARALAQQTPVLLFDEPTSNLDLKNQLEVLQTIRTIVREKGLTAVVTIHDLNLALRFADRFLIMKEGRVYADGGAEAVNTAAIREVYGVRAAVMECSGRRVVVPE
ncbi:ABC transporter ATP-binding protein [Anaerofilum sp. BX8]|uniref:ABC transporter ATP-binding protein n=1 Tax=Anaerofilum hominis TaxID=2763016 RepID=A0A923I4A2_9FIRM|nr:ABC transporter ATP-binding protein [Anaerofilum hominis]MBC5580023.1 ABC transporter ATP-binding protein [Anaerofilum hominis]